MRYWRVVAGVAVAGMMHPLCGRAMKRTRPRRCLCCGELFQPDWRNAKRQMCCPKKACRAPLKAARQRRWLRPPRPYSSSNPRSCPAGRLRCRRPDAPPRASAGFPMDLVFVPIAQIPPSVNGASIYQHARLPSRQYPVRRFQERPTRPEIAHLERTCPCGALCGCGRMRRRARLAGDPAGYQTDGQPGDDAQKASRAHAVAEIHGRTLPPDCSFFSSSRTILPVPATSPYKMRPSIGRAEMPLNGRRRTTRLAPDPPTVYEFARAGAQAIIIGSMTRCSCIPWL